MLTFLIFSLSCLHVCVAQRVLTTTADSRMLYKDTPPDAYVGCVRVDSDLVMDMSKNLCKGGQCPRCFILTEGTTAPVVTLTLKSCNADYVYPPTRSDINLTSSKLFEYTFLNVGGQSTIFRIIAEGNPEDSQVFDIGRGVHRFLTTYCFDGVLYVQ